LKHPLIKYTLIFQLNYPDCIRRIYREIGTMDHTRITLGVVAALVTLAYTSFFSVIIGG